MALFALLASCCTTVMSGTNPDSVQDWFRLRDGQIMGTWLFLYGLARFFIEFYRGDPGRGSVFGGVLSVTQAAGHGHGGGGWTTLDREKCTSHPIPCLKRTTKKRSRRFTFRGKPRGRGWTSTWSRNWTG